MPRNTREWAIRKLGEVVTNLDWALYHLREVYDKYQPVHPDIAERIGVIAEGLLVAQETVEAQRKAM